MSVPFALLSPTTRVPGAYVEVDASRARQGLAAVKPLKVVILGGRLTGGLIAENVKFRATNADTVRAAAGAGSMLHGMALAWFAQQNRALDVEFIGLNDDAAGVAAALTLTIGATAAGAGVVSLLVAGRPVRVLVAANDSANTIAANIRAVINGVDGMPVTASGASASVVLTAKNKGVVGNSLEARVNYFAGDALPTGVTVSGAGTFTGGATNPTIGPNTLAALGDVQYDLFVLPYNDATNWTGIDAELAARFGPERQLQGSAFTALRDSHANLITFGNAKNSPFITVVGVRNVPHPTWEWAAAIAAVASGSLALDPAAPVQNVDVAYLLPAVGLDVFDKEERELLLQDGIATTKVGPGGAVQVERLITTYQLTPAGAPDIAYLDSETLFSVSFLRWDWNRRLLAEFPRHKMAKDGTRFGANQRIVTPAIVKALFATALEAWVAAGIVEDPEQALRDFYAEIDAADPTRMNIILPPNLVNGARVFATLLQFRL